MLRIIQAAVVLATLFSLACVQASAAANRDQMRIGSSQIVRAVPQLSRSPRSHGYFRSLSEGVLYNFRNGADGTSPAAPLISDSSGSLYGTTELGGEITRGVGIVYKLTRVGSGFVDVILYRFHGPDGAYPIGGLIADNTGALYGTTSEGGAANQGTVFKLTPNGNRYFETILYSFQGGIDGSEPVGSLTADSSGALYGTTETGGTTNAGTVFKLTPNGNGYIESVLYRFQGGTDGANPVAAVLEDSSGALYSTTRRGGSANVGTVFKLTPSGSSYSESILYQFQGTADGGIPNASLVADSAGALYSTTNLGGAFGAGAVFKLMPNGNAYSESVIYSFQNGTDGGYPESSLVFDASGALYGTTTEGGAGPGFGTVFKLTPGSQAFSESTLYNFSGGMDGRDPYASVIIDNTGSLYGTTVSGGTNSGTVFKLTLNNNSYSESVLHSFHSQADAANPQGAIVGDAKGALYGTTFNGGPYGRGTIFKLTPKRSGYAESVLYSFRGSPDGANPVGGLIADGNGALYGTTTQGGINDWGTVFKLTPNGNSYIESILHTFQDGNDGITPRGSLVADGLGDLFGTTAQGGPDEVGTVFKLTPNGSGYNYNIIYDFRLNSGDGYLPLAALIMDSLGALYGTTSGGGVGPGCDGGCGTVFKLTPNGGIYSENILYSFGGLADGAHPASALIADSSGSLYGTTGGNKGFYGTVFELTPIGGGYTHTVLHQFARKHDGHSPAGPLLEDNSGNIFGTTYGGGTSGFGTTFELTPNGNAFTESILHNFHGGTDGANPFSYLIADGAGAIYGTTYNGGKFGQGTVFKLIP